MPPDSDTLATRNGDRVAYRHDPVPLLLVLPPFRSVDGHEIALTATLTMRLLDRPADLALFNELFLATADRVTFNDIRQRLDGPLVASLSEFFGGHDAETGLRQQVAVETLIVQRCDAIGFGCGLQFGPLAALRIESESLQYARQRADAETRRFQVLDEARRLKEKLDAVGPAHRLPAAEQSALLPTLLHAAADRPSKILVTAGSNLIAIDAGKSSVTASTGPLGAARCVMRLSDNPDAPVAIGCQRGVLVLEDGGIAGPTYAAPNESARGFNAVARTVDGRIVATHGDLGLVVWSAGQPDSATVIAAPSPRAILALNERALFASAGQVCVFDGRDVRPIGTDGSPVVALLAMLDWIAVVRQDGGVALIDRRDLRVRSEFRTGRVTAATLLQEGGLSAIVIVGDDGVECRTRDGTLLGRAEPRPAGLRMVGFASGRIIGVSADRATVAAWDWSSPQHPLWTVNVLARHGNHVTDLLGTPTEPASL